MVRVREAFEPEEARRIRTAVARAFGDRDEKLSLAAVLFGNLDAPMCVNPAEFGPRRPIGPLGRSRGRCSA